MEPHRDVENYSVDPGNEADKDLIDQRHGPPQGQSREQDELQEPCFHYDFTTPLADIAPSLGAQYGLEIDDKQPPFSDDDDILNFNKNNDKCSNEFSIFDTSVQETHSQVVTASEEYSDAIGTTDQLQHYPFPPTSLADGLLGVQSQPQTDTTTTNGNRRGSSGSSRQTKPFPISSGANANGISPFDLERLIAPEFEYYYTLDPASCDNKPETSPCRCDSSGDMGHKKLNATRSDGVSKTPRSSLQYKPDQNLLGTSALQRSQSARNKGRSRSSQSPSDRYLKPDRRSSSRSPYLSPNRQSGRLPQRTQSARYKNSPYVGKGAAGGGSRNRFRERTGSVPNDDASYMVRRAGSGNVEARFLMLPESQDYERLRNFAIEKGSVINRGDSFRRRSRVSEHNKDSSEQLNDPPSSRSSSVKSIKGMSSAATTSPETQSPRSGTNTVTDNIKVPPRFTVSILGSKETGKTSLITQFLSSEYTNPFNEDLDDSSTENATISILLEKVESELTFTEVNLQKDAIPDLPDADGFIVLYATDNRESFRHGEEVLQRLTSRDYPNKPVMLVGNKIDLARKKIITTEDGSSLANFCDAKFVEISVALNHHIDELLVGLLAQMRLYRQGQLPERKGRDSASPLLKRNGSSRRSTHGRDHRKMSSKCTSSFASAKNAVLSCFTGHRRRRSAEKLIAFENQ